MFSLLVEIEENRNEIVDTVLVNVITGEVNSDIDVPTLTNEERAEVGAQHKLNLDMVILFSLLPICRSLNRWWCLVPMWTQLQPAVPK